MSYMDLSVFDNGIKNVKVSREKASQFNALSLAFVGDGVYTMYVRTQCMKHYDLKANKMDAFCRTFVSAKGQVVAYKAIEEELSDEEISIGKRARNSHPANSPKNATLGEYMTATAFEAVLGYLYIIEEYDRLYKILEISMKSVIDEGMIK